MQTVMKASGAGRTYRFIASTPNVDRAGDTIQPNWDLDAFRRTGMPIQWAHDYSLPPIGRGVAIGVEGRNLVIEMEFAPREAFALAGEIQDLVDAGFIKSVSVGFKPLEWSYLDRGMDITRSELLEVSIVAIPMNSEAVLLSKGAIAPVYSATPLPHSRVLMGCRVAEVQKWFSSVTSEKRIMVKAPPPPAAAPAGAAPDPGPGPADDAQDAAKVDQIVQLLTPDAQGSITQQNHDKAMALLQELKVALGGQPDQAAPAPDAGAPPPPPAKGISVGGQDMSALLAEMKSLTAALARREFALIEDEPENESLESVFSNPDMLNQLRTQSG